MRPIVSFISAAAFLLHMWLGCCAHHAHACEGSACPPHSVEAVDHSHADHDHGVNSPCEQSPTDSPCPAERCDGSQCVFVSVGKTELPQDSTIALLPVLSSTACAGLCTAHAVSVIDTGGLIALPVRIHLFNQVLLT
jgi:hypothetical protein